MARWTTYETVLNPKNSFDSTFTVFWKKHSHCRGLKWSEQPLWKARAPYVHKQSKTFIAFNEILASFPRLKYGFVFYRGQGRLHDCTNSYSWVLSFPKDLFIVQILPTNMMQTLKCVVLANSHESAICIHHAVTYLRWLTTKQRAYNA